jgi:hypothetical protein
VAVGRPFDPSAEFRTSSQKAVRPDRVIGTESIIGA